MYDFGCSDGSEAYTLAISLIEELGEKEAQRFFPIKAADRDYQIIRTARSGKIMCLEKDIDAIDKNTKGRFEKYFSIVKKDKGVYLIEPKEILKNCVEFKRAEFSVELDNIEGSNTLVMCRNFWRYMDKSEVAAAVLKLRDTLGEDSRILIGDFDYADNGNFLPSFFDHAGIKEAGWGSLLKVDKALVEKERKKMSNEQLKKYLTMYSPY